MEKQEDKFINSNFKLNLNSNLNPNLDNDNIVKILANQQICIIKIQEYLELNMPHLERELFKVQSKCDSLDTHYFLHENDLKQIKFKLYNNTIHYEENTRAFQTIINSLDAEIKVIKTNIDTILSNLKIKS